MLFELSGRVVRTRFEDFAPFVGFRLSVTADSTEFHENTETLAVGQRHVISGRESTEIRLFEIVEILDGEVEPVGHREIQIPQSETGTGIVEPQA